MAVISITDPDSAGDISALLDRVRQGEEIVFKDGDKEIAVLQQTLPKGRPIDECIALLPEDSPPVDEDFARDVEAAIAWHREPLDSSAWD